MNKGLDLQHPPDEDLKTYAFVVLFKTLVLPSVSYFFIILLKGSPDLATLGFIVGALPCAPTVAMYAIRYSTEEKNYVASVSQNRQTIEQAVLNHRPSCLPCS